MGMGGCASAAEHVYVVSRSLVHEPEAQISRQSAYRRHVIVCNCKKRDADAAWQLVGPDWQAFIHADAFDTKMGKSAESHCTSAICLGLGVHSIRQIWLQGVFRNFSKTVKLNYSQTSL